MATAGLDPNSAAYRKAYKHYLKSAQTAPTSTWSAFRVVEKQYKTRFPPPTLHEVIDLTQVDGPSEDTSLSGSGWAPGSCEPSTVSEVQVSSGSSRAFEINDIPGLVILPGFLPPEEQKSLIVSCLRDQSRHPNETNLDAHYEIPDSSLWEHWEQHWRATVSDQSTGAELPNILIHPKAAASLPPSSSADSASATKRSLVDNPPASPSILPTLISLSKPPPTPSHTLQATPVSRLLYKMRWANLGRSYHWGTKSYNFSKKLAPFPTDIRDVCKRAVKAVEWKDIWGDGCGIPDEEWGDEGVNWMTWKEDYEPDAGIVNYYQNSDTLMGHVDRSELSSTTPLVSISLGNAAVFLIGGLTRDTKPIPILLRSGDVVIMSGPRCRRAYHGVPRILEGTLPPHLCPAEGPTTSKAADEWAPFGAYMVTSRINVNVRQVFPKGFVPPEVVNQP